MKVVRFSQAGFPRLGVLTDERVVDLVEAAIGRGQAWLGPAFTDLRLFLASEGARQCARQLAASKHVPSRALGDVRLLAPFEQGSKILAHVVNYVGHDAEAKVKVPEKPFFFQKPGSCVGNPGDPIIAHSSSSKLDHEVEIAVMIGKVGRNISRRDAMSHVGGYAVLNDVSYRDYQMNDGFPDLNTSYGKNWTKAKGLDLACPMGPMLVLSDEMPEPYPLQKICRVNGKVRQNANSSQMIHKVPALIEEASKGMTLWPGDVIATGTPSGGGLGDGVWLRPGDVVECEVEGLGTLRNLVVTDEVA